jgi:penicillin-binding protein 2
MFKTRLIVLSLLILAGQLMLIRRLGALQLFQAGAYRREAQAMLERQQTYPTRRGGITDRNGLYLAADKEAYALCLDYRLLSADMDWREDQILAIARNEVPADMPDRLARAEELFARREDATWKLVEELSREQGVDASATIRKIIERVERVRRAVGQEIREEREYHPVVTGLNSQRILEGTVGAKIEPMIMRRYPHGDAASHLIGTVGRVNAAEMDAHNLSPEQTTWAQRVMHNYQGDDVIGKTGVEKLCELQLRGQRGYQRVRRRGQTFDVLEEVLATPGSDIHLSIDIHLQEDIEALFRAKAPGHNGAVVVLDVPTGEVLAAVSIPTYDLNTYRTNFSTLVEDEIDLPLLSRAVGRGYPPGSTVKPISAIAGLADGVVNAGTTFHCAGYMYSPDSFRCWIYKNARVGHGELDASDAIKNSCNVYFYHVGEMLGVYHEKWWMEQFGFGQKPGTGLPEERAGTVAENLPVGTEKGASRMLAIGQGPFDATPLQCANGLATVARNGEYLSPVLVLGDGPEQKRWQVDAPREHFELVKEGMYRVCNEYGGTAYKVFHGGLEGDTFEPLSFEVSGKTGTAQAAPQRVDSDEDGRITGRDLPVREGDMAWFGGFGPSRDPQVAVVVVVEYVEGGGSRNAAPIGREVFRLCKARGYIR